MPGIFPLHLALLLAFPPDAQPVPPGITPELPGPELPGGADAAFRLPSTEEAPEMRPVVANPPRRAGTRGPLPRLSSRFGRRGDPIRQIAAIHYGIDIPGPLGTPVLAAAPGTVRFAGSAGSYGEMIEIAHDGALGTRYAHLSRVLVRPGVHVERGQPIALMGSTGRSTGNHLHFEVRIGGVPVDPLPYLQAGDETALASRPRAGIASDQPHISAFARARALGGSQERGL